MGLLITKFSQNGHIVVQAHEDADNTLICNTAIAVACKGKTVTAVGKDVDLMCILVTCTPSIAQMSYGIPEIWETNTAITFILNTQYPK